MKKQTGLNILFFTTGGILTPELEEAGRAIEAKHGKNVVIRNPDAYGPGDFIEPGFAVAGKVPKDYADRFPRVSLEKGYELIPLSGAAAEKVKEAASTADKPKEPKTKAEAKKALDDLGAEYHANQPLPALVKLWKEAVAKANEPVVPAADQNPDPNATA